MRRSVLLVFLAGCAGRPLPDPAAERVFARKVEEVFSAAVAAAQDYDLTLEARSSDSSGGRLEALRGDGDRVTLTVRDVGAERSEVRVEVDPVDPVLAAMLLDRVSSKLGTREAR